jgi:hypothetical protein
VYGTGSPPFVALRVLELPVAAAQPTVRVNSIINDNIHLFLISIALDVFSCTHIPDSIFFKMVFGK